MKIEGSGLEQKELTLEDLDHVAYEIGFVRWSWDYKRATYDFKYVDKKLGETFYLRLPVVAIKGIIEEEGNDSVVQIRQPYVGRHLHPHGFDYEYNFPQYFLDDVNKRLEALKNSISS
jgi:hypothetical protein